jgi:hypothetical protein
MTPRCPFMFPVLVFVLDLRDKVFFYFTMLQGRSYPSRSSFFLTAIISFLVECAPFF